MALTKADITQALVNARCFCGLSRDRNAGLQAYFLAVINGLPTDSGSLVALSACQQCAPKDNHDSILAWIITNETGVTGSPAQVIASSPCIQCIPPGWLEAFKTYMLYTTALESSPTVIDPVPSIAIEDAPSWVSTPSIGETIGDFISTVYAPDPWPTDESLAQANIWADEVVTNGGTRPTLTTIKAIGFLYDDLKAASVFTKFHTLDIFVPDNLTAARTPVIHNLGLNPYTNTNFVEADLNKYGLKGDAATKHLDSGVNVNAINLNDMSMIVMVDDTPINYAGIDCGVWDAGLNAYQVVMADSNTSGAQQGCLADTIGRNFTYNVMPAYLCTSRTATNLSKLFIANKWNPHYSVGDNTGVIVHPGINATMTVFARKRHLTGVIDAWTGRRMKVFALSTAMSETESLACYNAFLACRQRFEDGSTTYGQDWGYRVQKAGGAAPSAATIAALDTFMNTLTSSGLLAKIDCINAVAPDNLIAATVPIWRKWGNDPWTNNGYLAGDLSVAGLVGAANKAFSSAGIIQGRSMRLGQNTGWTYYFSVASVGGVIGCLDTEYQLVVPAPGQLLWDTPFNGGGGRLTIGAGMGAGYYHCMRNSNSNAQVFSANSGLPHGLRGTNSTGAIPALSSANTTLVNVMGRAPFPGGGQMSGTLSFWSFGQALTLAESSTYFNAIQALRTALGGGYV